MSSHEMPGPEEVNGSSIGQLPKLDGIAPRRLSPSQASDFRNFLKFSWLIPAAAACSPISPETPNSPDIFLEGQEAKDIVANQWTREGWHYKVKNSQSNGDFAYYELDVNSLTGPQGGEPPLFGAWDYTEDKPSTKKISFVQATLTPETPNGNDGNIMNFIVIKSERSATSFLLGTPDTEQNRAIFNQKGQQVGILTREDYISAETGATTEEWSIRMGTEDLHLRSAMNGIPATKEAFPIEDTISTWLLNVGITPVYAKGEIVTPTKVYTPKPPATETATPPAFKFEMPLTDENTFDFSRIEEYPELEDLNRDLRKFITECQQRKLMRDFSNMSNVTDLNWRVVDNRGSDNPDIWRNIASSLDPQTYVPLGTEPVYTPAGARFTMVIGQNSESVLIFPVQYYVPDAIGKSVIVYTYLPDRIQNWNKVPGLNNGNMYPALSGSFLPGILNGTIPPNSQLEFDAYLLHQLGLTQSGDRIMLQLWKQHQLNPDAFMHLIPEADLKMFSGEILPIKAF